MKFTHDKLQEYIDKKMLMRQKHPVFDYYIYNYTPEVQFKKLWNPTLMACRGLILDGDSNVIARPFTKFFNYSELGPSARGTLNRRVSEVYEKMDGSLGIMYPHPGFEEFSIASRGSFTSPQALFGTDLLNNKYRKWTKHFRYEPENFPENSIFLAEKTVIFEIIYPENRIVVNYGDMEDMVYLGVVENSTGNDLYPVIEKDWPFPVVRRYTELENLTMDELVERVNNHEDYGNNREGYVVKFKNGSRTKLKYPDYIRLHRIMTDMSEKRILEAVIQGPLSEEFLDGVPDECYDWLKDVEKRFRAEYETIKLSCQLFYQQCQLKQIGDAPKFTRKDWALAFLKTPYPAVLFNMLDGNDYSPAIWAKIEPKPGKQTFQTSGYNRTKEKT